MATDKVKRVNIRKKLLGAMFVVSLLLIMISVSFAWFTTGESASVSGIQMNVTEGDDLLLKIGDEDSGSKNVKFDFDREYPLQAVSGNGKYFYNAILGYPEEEPLAQEGEGSTVLEKVVVGYTPISLDGTIESYLYSGIFAYDFSLHSGSAAPVYLYAESSDPDISFPSTVRPAPAADYGENSNISPYGDFDIGYVCGAVRIAILQKDANGEYQPTFLWAPATAVELYTDEDGKLQLETDASRVNYEASYLYLGETVEDTVTEIEISTDANRAQGSVVIDGVTYAWGALSSKMRIGELVGGEDTDFRLVVWVDGNDRECHNALLSGLIFVALHFGL